MYYFLWQLLKLKRYAQVRNIRLKSHQLGITISHPDAENIEKESESTAQEKSQLEEGKNLIMDDKNLPLNVQSCSTSLEDNLFEFANSRTMIKS